MAVSTQVFVSPSTLVRVGFFALVYYLGVRVGLELVISPGMIWALSPANPIAIALVIQSPARIWPAYFLALFPSTLFAVLPAGEFSVLTVLGLTASNAIGIFLGAWLMRRFVGAPITFTRVRDVLGLVVFAAGLGSAFSGVFGAAVFVARLPDVSYWSAWAACTIGNATGILFITPVLLVGTTAAAISVNDMRFPKVVEAVALCAVILAASVLVFGHDLTSGKLSQLVGGTPPHALSYIMFPWLIWAALRFGPRGAAASSFTVGLAATWSTYHGYGPFVVDDGPVATDIFSLQLYLATVVLTTLLPAAIIAERKRAKEALVESEARMRELVESTSDWVWHMGADLRFSYFSARFPEVTGIPPEDVLGKTRLELGRGDVEEEKWRRHLADLEARRPFRDFCYKLMHRDGRTLHFLTNGKPVFDKVGSFQGYRGVGSDITARVNAEEQARSARERLAIAINGLSEHFVLFDSEDRIVLTNAAWRELNRKVIDMTGPGVCFEDQLRAAIKAGLLPEAMGREDEWLRWRMDRHRNPKGPFEVERQDGRWLLVNEKRLLDGGTVLIISDITERKQAEKKVRRSEELLRGAVDSLQEGFALYDADDRLVLFNDEYLRLHPDTEDMIKPGMGYAEMLRANVENGANGDAIGREEVFIRERLERHRNPRGSIERRLTSGVTFIIKESRTRDGGIAVTLTDITERKRAEEKLRASEQRFKDVAEAASDWFWEMDENLRFTFFSGRRRQLIDLSSKENIGRKRWEVAEANPDEDEKWRHHRATLEAHEAFRDFEYAWNTKDGKTVHNKISGRPIFDANGVFKGYRGAATDVTEQIEAQAQLIQASKLATLGEMASGIAHELNQPLSVVGMAAELSLMSMDAGAFDTDFVRRKLETIAGQKERMAGIIDHMRLFSRKDQINLEPFDPAESVRGAVGLTAKQLEASGIELKATVPAACRNVSGHFLQLEQVVLNLLNNARDAVADAMETARSGNGRPAPRVRVSLVDDKRRKAVIISVADTGGGIPEQALGRIFDPFFTTKTEGQGTGLGLSISYSIIDAMGGRLEAQNADGGAVFRITLPVCDDRPGAAGRRPKARNRKPPTCKPRSQLPRVLFVEDEEAIVAEVAEYLRRKGYEVLTAGNAVEALELHARCPADMVITDLLMPGMGGNELIRRLRQADPELPIVVVTGHTNFGEEQDIVAEGASAVLQKPISLRELSERLQRMVNR